MFRVPRECLSSVRGPLFLHRQDEEMGTQGSGKKKTGKCREIIL